MSTIDPRLVPSARQTDVFRLAGSTREQVRRALAETPQISHVEGEYGGGMVTVEMASGAWLTVPRAAIVV